ncbi:PF07602 domain protein [Leptospira interrogans serovar Bataviae str. UI 08561]|nr:PF07602 domain protein [Leptospira interrogans serovar Bataviae str. UI 08561]
MKQILSITLFMFLVGCVTENQESEKSSSVLSGVFNQQLLKLTLDHEKNSSSITVYNVSYFVDSVGGMDSYPGTSNQPFKTITKALSLVKAGDSIFVAPGTYDAASGERFPLIVPDEVQLIGDELGKGMVGGEQSTGYHGSGSFRE